ncbi:MAG: murein biosynthesis integral membrane protein MurJ [Kiritimatiellales bacterium]|nr:murein biosynthesis integral membrane protein MurJ [Kiritimatiellales bacterium]MCF7864833.1 murein biosynthesis integral membrane protein MurJ [Kiritimatiellales bacterium]
MRDRKVIRSAGVVGSFTLLSRGLGMLRDVIFAYFFGTSLFASAFLVAFKIPNLFRRLFGEGALSAAFIPVLIETRTKEGDQAAWDMAAKVVTMAAAVLTAIALVGVLAFSIGLHIPNISEKWLTNFGLSRVMFPYVLLICMASLSMAVLNSYKHFATSAFAPCLLNLILIAVMLCLFPFIGHEDSSRAYALAWAVLLAGVAQVAIQLPTLKRFGCPFKFSSHWNDPRIRRILYLMGPAALGAGITQINVLLDGYLAVWIGDWAPAALFYSERLVYFPLGIIATALGTVLLPTFSTHAAEKNIDAMRDTITHSLRHLIYIMTPAALGLLVLAPFILQAIFEWNGSFNAQSTLFSTRALMCYAPGLLVFSASKVFVPAFYAMQDTRTPVRIGICTVLLNLVLNITFILTLPLYWKHAGMALATVLSEAAGMVVLGIILARRIKGLQWLETARSLVRCLVSASAMAAAAWLTAWVALPVLGNLLPSKIAQMLAVGLAIGVGAALYFLLTLLLRAPELHEIKSALRRHS